MKRLLCFAVAMFAVSAGAAHLTIAPRSTLLLNGSSNLTRWRCSGSTLNGQMDVSAPLEKINEVIDRVEDGQIGAFLVNPAAARIPQPQFDLSIRIDALRCSGGHPMERDVIAALKANQYPAIRVRFRELRGPVEHDIDSHLYRFAVAMDISLAGATREVDITVVAERIARDTFRITAALPLRMTEFGVRPPRALFGMIKAADQMTVNLDLVLEAEPNA